MHAEPVRYHLMHRQVDALLQLLEIVPDGVVLRPGPSSADPAREAGDALDEEGRVPPVLAAALGILAKPRRIVTLDAVVPGSDSRLRSTIAAGATGGPYVICSSGDALEVLVLGSEMEAAAVLDDVFDLTTYPARAATPDIELDLAAWMGLLAAADARRTGRLESQLARRQARPFTFDAAALDGQLSLGLQADDSRWAVTSAVTIAPTDVRSAHPEGEACLRALVAAGLAEPKGPMTALTGPGLDLADLIEQSIKIGSVALQFPGSAARGAAVTLWRSPLAFALTFWRMERGEVRGVVVRPGPEAAVEMLRRIFLFPVPVEGTEGAACPSCRAAVLPEFRFCAACGADLTAAEVG